MKYFLTLVSIILLFGPVTAQTTYEQYMSSGLSNLEKKDYDKSEEAFRSALKEIPDDYKATLYLGIALSRKGSKEGESLLKKALLTNPQEPRTNLELGVYYFNKSIYPEAKDYFENTIELAPVTEYSSEARKYLNSMKGKEWKPWGLDAALGMQYDTNVILGPDNMPLPQGISGKSDWRGVGYLKGQYNFKAETAPEFNGSLSYSGYQSLHTRLSDFNISQHAAGLDATFNISRKATLKGTYNFEYVWVGGDSYDYAHTLTPSLIINEGDGLSTVVHYTYSKSHFMNADLFPDNSDRTGFNHSSGITQYVPLGNLMEAKLGYSYDRDNTRKDFWAYRGNKGFLNLTIKFLRSLSADIYGEYYDKDYKGISPLSGTVRHDIIHTYALTLTKKLSDRFSLVLGQFYVRNKSNINVFDYKRAITSIFITVRF